MEYSKVLITRDPMEKIPVIVPAHEVPILENVHGQDAVTELTLTPKEARQLAKLDEALRERIENERKAAADEEGNEYSPMSVKELIENEHLRLEGKYGMHPEVKMPHVEHVYGRVTTGALKAAMGLTTVKASKPSPLTV